MSVLSRYGSGYNFKVERYLSMGSGRRNVRYPDYASNWVVEGDHIICYSNAVSLLPRRLSMAHKEPYSVLAEYPCEFPGTQIGITFPPDEYTLQVPEITHVYFVSFE